MHLESTGTVRSARINIVASDLLSYSQLDRRLLSHAVGYYRVIAQKVLQSKSLHQDLLKTPKNIKMGPIIMENDKYEKG